MTTAANALFLQPLQQLLLRVYHTVCVCLTCWMWLGTNLIHDFMAVTFSVKLVAIREKLIHSWNPVIFCEFLQIWFFLWRLVASSGRKQHFWPSYLLTVAIFYASMTLSVIIHSIHFCMTILLQSSLVFIFMFRDVCQCRKCIIKNVKIHMWRMFPVGIKMIHVNSENRVFFLLQHLSDHMSKGAIDSPLQSAVHTSKI